MVIVFFCFVYTATAALGCSLNLALGIAELGLRPGQQDVPVLLGPLVAEHAQRVQRAGDGGRPGGVQTEVPPVRRARPLGTGAVRVLHRPAQAQRGAHGLDRRGARPRHGALLGLPDHDGLQALARDVPRPQLQHPAAHRLHALQVVEQPPLQGLVQLPLAGLGPRGRLGSPPRRAHPGQTGHAGKTSDLPSVGQVEKQSAQPVNFNAIKSKDRNLREKHEFLN